MIWLFSQAWAINQPSWYELYPEQGWKHKNTIESKVGEIEIYVKELEGVPCFQARTPTEIESDLILEIASDAESSLKWSSAGLLEAETLLRKENYVDYYQFLEVPFVSDRFWILRGYFETLMVGDATARVWR